MTVPVFKIVPTIQQYDWGRIGNESKVAQFAAASGVPEFTVDDAQPYAELWIGTHPKSPSKVAPTGQLLSEYLKADPSLIGEQVAKQFKDAQDGNLPFLFKVLSIGKALSIQAHPDKKKAATLHSAKPEIYKDPNHKPEMALALTPFRALCGFRPLLEILANINATPELASLIPPLIRHRFTLLPDTAPTPSPFSGTGPAIAEAKQGLQDIFTNIMTKDVEEIKRQLATLVARYEKREEISGVSQELIDLVLRLNSQFPGDVGVFCVFLLNYVTLNPGEAIFLGAGEPHAYVEGDIIECMANSDNVLRAGLTPKLRDVPNLIHCLNYGAAPPSKHVVEPVSFTDRSKSKTAKSLLYDPPISEFSVVQVKLGPSEKEAHRAIDGPTLFVVTTGGGKVAWGQDDSLDLGLGDTVFIGAGAQVEFTSGGDGLVLYRSFVEVP